MAFTAKEKRMFEAGLFCKKLFNETTVSGGGSIDATMPDIMICEEFTPTTKRIRADWVPYVEKIKKDGQKDSGYFVKPSYLINLLRSVVEAQNVSFGISDFIYENGNNYYYGIQFSMYGSLVKMYISFKQKHIFTDGEYLDIEECYRQGASALCISAGDFYYGHHWTEMQGHNESTTGRGNPGNQERLFFDYKYLQGFVSNIVMIDIFTFMSMDEESFYLTQGSVRRFYTKGKMELATAKLTAGFNPIALNNLFYGFMCNTYPSNVFNDSTGVKMAKPHLLYGSTKYYPKGLGQLIISINKEFIKVKDLISGTIYIIRRFDYAFVILAKIEGGN